MKLRCDATAIIILWFIIGAGILSLGGCARKTPTDTVFAEVEHAVSAVKKALPTECLTPAVVARLDAMDATYRTAQVTCENQIKAEQLKFSRLLWVLSLWILLVFGKFLLKKV